MCATGCAELLALAGIGIGAVVVVGAYCGICWVTCCGTCCCKTIGKGTAEEL